MGKDAPDVGQDNAGKPGFFLTVLEFFEDLQFFILNYNFNVTDSPGTLQQQQLVEKGFISSFVFFFFLLLISGPIGLRKESGLCVLYPLDSFVRCQSPLSFFVFEHFEYL